MATFIIILAVLWIAFVSHVNRRAAEKVAVRTMEAAEASAKLAAQNAASQNQK